jgi:hypothetical protein
MAFACSWLEHATRAGAPGQIDMIRRRLRRRFKRYELPSGSASKVDRYIFQLTYAMRSLPDKYTKSVVEEIRSAIEEAVEHHVESGYSHDDAYERALLNFMAPGKLGKQYISAYHRRPGALPELSESVLLIAATASAAVLTFQSAHSILDLSLAATTVFVSLTSVLRLTPLTRMLGFRKAAAHLVDRAVFVAAPTAALPALIALHAQFTVTLWPASLVAHFSLSNLSSSALLSIGTVLVLERNRRVLKDQHRVLHLVTHDRAFAAAYFRVTEQQREEETRFGYFTESID